jgi:signal transduction histidine kinase
VLDGGIVESASALTELIADVLELSKIEAGTLSIERFDFDLQDLLHSVQRGFRELGSAKNLEMPLTIAPNWSGHGRVAAA